MTTFLWNLRKIQALVLPVDPLYYYRAVTNDNILVESQEDPTSGGGRGVNWSSQIYHQIFFQSWGWYITQNQTVTLTQNPTFSFGGGGEYITQVKLTLTLTLTLTVLNPNPNSKSAYP